MKIYEDRNEPKPQNACGYCRKRGHNKYQCPEVDKDWAWWKDFTVPPFSGGWYRTRNNPDAWAKWFSECKDIYVEKERRKNAPKETKKRSPSKCGFCGGEGHNRRQCSEMESLKKQCYKANENWRRAAYKEIVEKHGICVGACIEVQKNNSTWATTVEPTIEVAIITKVNFDSLNVMAAKTGYIESYTNPYECTLDVKAMINGVERYVSIRTKLQYLHSWQKNFIELDSEIIATADQHYHSQWYMSKLISRSEYPLNEKWITDYKGAFDLLLKKRSKKQLDKDGATCLINKWAKKD